jgi:hypothetical protein
MEVPVQERRIPGHWFQLENPHGVHHLLSAEWLTNNQPKDIIGDEGDPHTYASEKYPLSLCHQYLCESSFLISSTITCYIREEK